MKVILKKGKEKSLLRKHPWVFSGAIDRLELKTGSADVVEVLDNKGKFLAVGLYSEKSQIRVRILDFLPAKIDNTFFEQRIHASIKRRQNKITEDSADRLIFSESDLLPGLIVDSYAGHFVVQYLCAGMDRRKNEINEILLAHPGCKSLYERSDSASRGSEGLGSRCGVIGKVQPPELIEIIENGTKFYVDVRKGHKTGFYLDQKHNRDLLRRHSKGRDTLNCFSYTGGFGLSALAGDARSVINIDTSAESLSMLDKNIELNGFSGKQSVNECGDVFEILRRFKTEGKKFDLIVLDPPKFAQSKTQIIKAARGYKDINRIAFELLNPDGLLFTFSCSGHISPALFQKIVSDAAVEAGLNVQIIERMTQYPDHPVLLSFPESEYLKGLICHVI